MIRIAFFASADRSSTGLSRADSYSLVYAGQLLGIALMFSGFAFVGKKPAPRRRSGPVPVAQPLPE